MKSVAFRWQPDVASGCRAEHILFAFFLSVPLGGSGVPPPVGLNQSQNFARGGVKGLPYSLCCLARSPVLLGGFVFGYDCFGSGNEGRPILAFSAVQEYAGGVVFCLAPRSPPDFCHCTTAPFLGEQSVVFLNCSFLRH